MIRGNGVSLSPLYDVMCGEVWASITKKLAQKIADESGGERLKEGIGCGLPESVVSILARFLNALAPWQKPQWPRPKLQHLRWLQCPRGLMQSLSRQGRLSNDVLK
jgi:hypothetical protein